jgi:DNA-binding MarR family transcriptional regulator
VNTLVLLLARLSRLNEAFSADACRRHGISPSDLRALAILRHLPGQSASPTRIARAIVQTSGGLTATLRRLEAQGLVERSADASDGRGRLVVLTDRGARFHDRVFEDLLARYEGVLSGVDVDGVLGAVRSLIAPLEVALHVAPSAGWAAAESAGVRP